MATAIKVENLSKAYQLGQIGTGTISRDLERWWALKRGKEDPFLKIGEANDRASKGTSNVVWSLKDINFEIKQGDAVGIIGRNGAGKSTLLKLLSRVTAPTAGQIKVKGRIASLLEVGTGFHPELTGKENIFLNGAILGMRRREIQKKFDEIVDFAGIERYVDTPVKRYSSGMYVRLAFAVAAHLESEILIVDEVLAVGDAEFQKKCLGKMDEVSKGQGRTVLFVSHNMGSIQALCTSAILLENGSIKLKGDTKDVLSIYNNISTSPQVKVFKEKDVFISSFAVSNSRTGEKGAYSNEPLKLEFSIVANSAFSDVTIGVGINDMVGTRICTLFSKHWNRKYCLEEGINIIKCDVEKLPLKPGSYIIEIYIGNNDVTLEYYDHGLALEVIETASTLTHMIPTKTQGHLIINQSWS